MIVNRIKVTISVYSTKLWPCSYFWRYLVPMRPMPYFWHCFRKPKSRILHARSKRDAFIDSPILERRAGPKPGGVHADRNLYPVYDHRSREWIPLQHRSEEHTSELQSPMYL